MNTTRSWPQRTNGSHHFSKFPISTRMCVQLLFLFTFSDYNLCAFLACTMHFLYLLEFDLLSSCFSDAFFWVGNTARPSPEGYIVPYPENYKGRWADIQYARGKLCVTLWSCYWLPQFGAFRLPRSVSLYCLKVGHDYFELILDQLLNLLTTCYPHLP